MGAEICGKSQAFVKTEHFNLEGLHTLPDLIQPQDWMIKLDLKDAYLQIPIFQEQQHLLQFQWNTKVYQVQMGLPPIQLNISSMGVFQGI